MRCAVLSAVLAIGAIACGSPADALDGADDRHTFVLIRPGEFVMGSPADEPGHQDDETAHRVRVTRSFYLSATEVTRAQWSALMPAPASGSSDPELPVVNVTWFEVNAFLDRLNATGRGASGCRPRPVGVRVPRRNIHRVFDRRHAVHRSGKLQR